MEDAQITIQDRKISILNIIKVRTIGLCKNMVRKYVVWFCNALGNIH